MQDHDIFSVTKSNQTKRFELGLDDMIIVQSETIESIDEAEKLLDPNKLLGIMDDEPDVKVKLPKVEATDANKIDRIKQIIYISNLIDLTIFRFSDQLHC